MKHPLSLLSDADLCTLAAEIAERFMNVDGMAKRFARDGADIGVDRYKQIFMHGFMCGVQKIVLTDVEVGLETETMQ